MQDKLAKDNFQEILPFYIAGTASDSETRFIEAYLKANPESRDELVVAQCVRSHIEQLGSHRNLDELASAFVDRYNQQKSTSIKTWIEKERDRLALWIGGAVGVPALVLNALEIDISNLGTAIINLLRIPDIINAIQGLFNPALIESLNQLSRGFV